MVKESEETTLHVEHGRRQAKPSRIEKLEKRVEELEKMKTNLAEYIFQTITIVLTLMGILGAVALVGISNSKIYTGEGLKGLILLLSFLCAINLIWICLWYILNFHKR